MARLELTGKRFGKLLVKELLGTNEKQQTLWKCQCDCGNECIVIGSRLTFGKKTSCGCDTKEKYSKSKTKDLTGQRFGRLVVVQENGKIKGKTSWLCKCDCGNERVAIGTYLKTGHTKSCGCLLEETRKLPKKTTHKQSKSRLYKEWCSMKSRCGDGYHGKENYKEKGITVCDEWQKFEPFAEWALSSGYKDDLTLDRIDNDKGYSPDNCRWVTMKAQENNRTNNVLIEYNGEVKTLKQWCEYFNVNYGMVKARRRHGWEINRLFIPPTK